jgi:hypothetical protein
VVTSKLLAVIRKDLMGSFTITELSIAKRANRLLTTIVHHLPLQSPILLNYVVKSR